MQIDLDRVKAVIKEMESRSCNTPNEFVIKGFNKQGVAWLKMLAEEFPQIVVK